MATSTMTSRGQITVPAAIRAELQLNSGDQIEFVKVGEGRYEMIAVSRDVTRLKGLVKSQKRMYIDEMNAAIKAKAFLK